MSRTIRRKNQNYDWWLVKYKQEFRDLTRKEEIEYSVWLRCSDHPKKGFYHIYQKFYHSDSWMVMNNPNWWTHIHNTKKLRGDTRKKIHRFMRDPDEFDYPVFNRKLKVPYYW